MAAAVAMPKVSTNIADPVMHALVACTAALDRQHDRRSLQDALEGVIDWRAFVLRAMRHGMVPLAAECISNAEVTVPEKYRTELRQLYLRGMKHNLRASAALAEIVSTLEQQGIIAVPFKGPAIAAWLYGNVALRQSADLDVVVSPKDVPGALAALHAMGYHGPVMRDYAELIRREYDVPLEREGVHIELHWSTLSPTYGISFTLDDCRRPLRRLDESCGVECDQPEPEDLFIMLALHGAKHMWGKLIWISDMWRLVNATEISWPTVMQTARRLRVERIALAAICMLSELYGFIAPRELHVQLQNARVQRIAHEALANLYSEIPQLEGGKQYWFFLRARDRWQDGFLHFMRHIVHSGAEEQESIPQWAPSWAALPGRWFRLIKRAALPYTEDE